MLLKLYFRQEQPRQSGYPFFHLAPMCRLEAITLLHKVRNTRADYCSLSNHRMLVQASKEKQAILLLPSTLLIEQKHHSEKWTAVPTHRSWAVVQRFCPGGEAGHRNSYRNAALPKGTDFIWRQSVGKLKPKRLSKTMEILVVNNLEETDSSMRTINQIAVKILTYNGWNFSKFDENINLLIQEAQWTPYRKNARGSIPRDIMSKCWKTKTKILESSKIKWLIIYKETPVKFNRWLLIKNNGGQKAVGQHIQSAELKYCHPRILTDSSFLFKMKAK